MSKLADQHVKLWIIKNRRTIFKQAAELGDLLRETFTSARVTYAKENGREIGKETRP